MFYNFKKKYKFNISSYILFLFFIIFFIKFSTVNANANTYKVRKDSWNFNIPMLVGDPNLDEAVNVLDVIYLVNYIFDYDGEKNIFDLYKIDINKDHNMDVTDIVGLVNLILY